MRGFEARALGDIACQPYRIQSFSPWIMPTRELAVVMEVFAFGGWLLT